VPARSPFEEVVENDLPRVAPLVRKHFAPRCAIQRYEGVMTRVWRSPGVRGWITAPFLWIGSWMQTLFPETGAAIPFAIVNRLFVNPDGTTRMSFERTFLFPNRPRHFKATMHYSVKGRVILDALGRAGLLLVEVHPSVSAEGNMIICSGRQWLTPFGPIRIRLPWFLAAHARICEWQEDEVRLGIRVTISHALLGPFFGYEGHFAEAPLEKHESDYARPVGPLLSPFVCDRAPACEKTAARRS